ncbi:MAG: hypothetical protein INQ03_19725 [Candidatus Heimdallarchaeota archaeon]|nr:hypothetical protein [Candidatus Heimdallarchaeota archaeon]
MKCLVIGEKTSQIKIFANTLCKRVSNVKHSKYIYEYNGTWIDSAKNISYEFTFLPLAGHISTIETAEGYNWGQCPPVKIVYDSKALVVKNMTKYVSILKKLIKGKDELWLATDPDSEGDNIALEVVNILSSVIKKNKIPIRRVWNSSLTNAEVLRSFRNPRAWVDLMGWSVQGRRITDAWLGFAGTREITRAARKVAKVKVISVGRVQLPTLYFIVYRDIAHESFISQDRWQIVANLSETSNFEPESYFPAIHSMGFTSDETIADNLLLALKHTKGKDLAQVKKIKTNDSSKLPPRPLNTTAAVSMLSKLMKISAKKALDLMVDLYNKQLLSYPRTENAKFKDNFPHQKIISDLLKYKEFIPIITKIKQNHQVVNNGKQMGVEDHDPIHPTGELVGIHNLDNQQLQAWTILSRHYISLFMHDYIISVVKADIDIMNELFYAEGRTIKQLGWKEAHSWDTRIPRAIPALQENQSLRVISIKKQKKPTQPPKRLTESDLLIAMESAKIGTKSSRPDIIKKLIDRNYLQRSGSNLISTDWGRALIASLSPIWPEIVTPTFTAKVEDYMDLVATGKEEYTKMLSDLKGEYISLHQKLIGNLITYQQLLQTLNLHSQSEKSKVHSPVIIQKLNQLFSTQTAPKELV